MGFAPLGRTFKHCCFHCATDPVGRIDPTGLIPPTTEQERFSRDELGDEVVKGLGLVMDTNLLVTVFSWRNGGISVFSLEGFDLSCEAIEGSPRVFDRPK